LVLVEMGKLEMWDLQTIILFLMEEMVIILYLVQDQYPLLVEVVDILQKVLDIHQMQQVDLLVDQVVAVVCVNPTNLLLVLVGFLLVEVQLLDKEMLEELGMDPMVHQMHKQELPAVEEQEVLVGL